MLRARARRRPSASSSTRTSARDASGLPVVSESFMPYDHANVQLAVDAYLAQEGRSSELHGATGQQRHYGSFRI